MQSRHQNIQIFVRKPPRVPVHMKTDDLILFSGDPHGEFRQFLKLLVKDVAP